MEQRQAVVFELDNVLYGLNIMEVQEIMRMVEITPVAELDTSIEGIINLRGHVIPVVNLCQKLGLSSKPYDDNSRIIVTEIKGQRVGVIVDRVLEVGTYKDEELSISSEVGLEVSCLKEIVKKNNSLWLILNLSYLH